MKSCSKCEHLAVWIYMPGDNVYCDDCVPRGCTCNHNYVSQEAYSPALDEPFTPEGEEGKDWKWIEEGKIWCDVDEQGREYPCVEYDWSPGGIEEE